jgi:hypothetical protein
VLGAQIKVMRAHLLSAEGLNILSTTAQLAQPPLLWLPLPLQHKILCHTTW